jgi:Icc-related predicted phosphoesterase
LSDRGDPGTAMGKLLKRRDKGRASASRDETTIYFASDLHGSTRCWKKFLAAPGFYGADIIIVGGDVTGKFLVPIVAQSDGTWRARYHGTERRLGTTAEVAALEQIAEDAGAYPVRLTHDEFEALRASQPARDELFRRAQFERLEMWADLADEKLTGTGVSCFVSGGNDDEPEIDALLAAHPSIEVPEGRVVELETGMEMISLGYANQTPWNCPRDISEEDLAAKISVLAGQLRRPERSIFNFHVPPYDLGLDLAPALDDEMTPVRSPSGEIIFSPVGSTAVRQAIERYQPLLGLHGHIHEGQGIRTLGPTVVANPGSEYQESILHGVLIKWDKGREKVKQQLVIG